MSVYYYTGDEMDWLREQQRIDREAWQANVGGWREEENEDFIKYDIGPWRQGDNIQNITAPITDDEELLEAAKEYLREGCDR